MTHNKGSSTKHMKHTQHHIITEGKGKLHSYKYPPRDRPHYAMIQCRWTMPSSGNSVSNCRYHHHCCFGHEEDRYFDDPWRVQRFVEGFNVDLWEAKAGKRREVFLEATTKANRKGMKGGHRRLMEVAKNARNQVLRDDDTEVLSNRQIPGDIQPIQVPELHNIQSIQLEEYFRQQQGLEQLKEMLQVQQQRHQLIQQQSEQHKFEEKHLHQQRFMQQFDQECLLQQATSLEPKPLIESSEICSLRAISQRRTPSMDSYFTECQPQQPHHSKYKDKFIQEAQVPAGDIWGYYGHTLPDLNLAKVEKPGLFNWSVPEQSSPTPSSTGSDILWMNCLWRSEERGNG